MTDRKRFSLVVWSVCTALFFLLIAARLLLAALTWWPLNARMP